MNDDTDYLKSQIYKLQQAQYKLLKRHSDLYEKVLYETLDSEIFILEEKLKSRYCVIALEYIQEILNK